MISFHKKKVRGSGSWLLQDEARSSPTAAPPPNAPRDAIPSVPRTTTASPRWRAPFLAPHGSPRRLVILLTFLYTFLDGAFYSVWGAQLLPLLLLKLAGETTVGHSAAIAGIAQLLSAAVAGCVADAYPRHYVIRVAAVMGLAALGLYLAALQHQQVRWFLIAQALWGAYVGLSSTSTEALFADSIHTGERTAIYNLKWMVQTLCYVVGYVTALCMLLRLGNDWELASIRCVMTVGYSLHPVAMFVLLGLHDDGTRRSSAGTAYVEVTTVEGTADAASDGEVDGTSGIDPPQEQYHALEGPPRVLATVPRPQSDRSTGGALTSSPASVASALSVTVHPLSLTPVEPVAGTQTAGAAPPHPEHPPESVEAENGEVLALRPLTTSSSRSFWCVSYHAIPFLVAFVDFLMALGSGMTLVYVPLFFVQEHQMTPVWLYLTYLTSTCLTAVVSYGAHSLVERVGMGRLPVVILVRAVGSFCLLIMGLAQGPVNTLHVLIPIFILRNACMNAVMGMTRSVIMDVVDSQHRAKWSACESLSSFTWAGSAAVGGYLVNRWGYQVNFCVTAVFHLAAGFVLIPAAIAVQPTERQYPASPLR